MSVTIEGYDKPKDCYNCPFNCSNLVCFITKGRIDRDDYDCDNPCPIKQAESEDKE